MNILIYGAGALGQAVGCMLSSAGHRVDLVLRRRFIDVLTQKGIRVSGVLGDFVGVGENLRCFSDVSEVKRDYDYCFVSTKSYDTQKAVDDLKSLADHIKYIVSMQNGCGNVELMQKIFGEEKTLGARVITGFEISEPGHVEVTVTADDIHVGGSKAGELHPGAVKLAGILTKAGHPTIAVEDIHSSLFAKLLYNCALNPLAALLGVHYGALSESEHTKKIMNGVIDETFAVISALGGKTPWTDAQEYKNLFYSTLIPATYNHRASMLQDLENNKPTEIDSLVGYVYEQGKLKGLDTPNCSLLTAMIKFKEEKNLLS